MRALKRLSAARDSEWEGFITHSPLYHRVFEGYSERKVPKENGNGTRIERVYVGTYYIRRGSGRNLALTKLLYVLLYLLAAAGFVYAFTRPVGYNSVWYGAVPAFAEAIVLLLFAADLFTCLGAPRRMTVYHYNAFGKLLRLSLLAVAAALAYALLYGVFLLRGGSAAGSLPVLLPVLLTAGMLTGIFLLERHAGYDALENEKSPGSDAVVIT